MSRENRTGADQSTQPAAKIKDSAEGGILLIPRNGWHSLSCEPARPNHHDGSPGCQQHEAVRLRGPCPSGLKDVDLTLATNDSSVDSNYIVGLRPPFQAGIMASTPTKRYEPNGKLFEVGVDTTSPENDSCPTYPDRRRPVFPTGIQASDLMEKCEKVTSVD